MRDYGTGSWDGGDPNCDHVDPDWQARVKNSPKQQTSLGSYDRQELNMCRKCGARRVDHQLGLEPTPDLYVQNMVAVFREVRRVLRRDGTCWLNIGDSYAASNNTGGTASLQGTAKRVGAMNGHLRAIPAGLKPKDIVGIPWLLARALQEPYYTGRISRERDRVWLAATLDAEGTICGFSHDRKDDGRTRTGLMFNITNSSEALLAEALRIWPTALHRHQRNGAGHLGQRDVWRWHVNGIANKTALVRELYPYLIVKRSQALLAYNLLVLMEDAKRAARTPQHGAVLEKRALLVRLLSDANQGRSFDVPSWCVEPPSLLEAGWYLRADIIWSKPNPMPESVTDRPTKAHEYVFLLTRSPRYFFDADAVREQAEYGRRAWANGVTDRVAAAGIYSPKGASDAKLDDPSAGRNVRSVWEIATQPYAQAHFATFPEALVERCVKAGTSERGCCPVCGAPWERETVSAFTKLATRRPTRKAVQDGADMADVNSRNEMGFNTVTTIGWCPTCDHGHEPIGAVVCDPFMGSGTTALVARRLGRKAIGVELNPEYCALAARRLQQLSLLAT